MPVHSRARRRSALLALLPLLFVACEDSGGSSAPSQLVPLLAAPADGRVGEAVPGEVGVQAQRADGRPAPGVRVEWEITMGEGALSAPSTTTGTDGRARVGWTLGVRPGEQRLRARAAGLPPVELTAMAAAGPAERVTLAPASLRLVALGDTARLVAVLTDRWGNPTTGSVAWSSSDEGVATAEGGLVTARGPGTATVRATQGAAQASARAQVEQAPASLTLAPADSTLPAPGATLRLEAVVRDRGGHPIAGAAVGWQSLDPSVATVEEGVVRALSEGTARIAASAGPAADTARVRVLAGAAAPARLVVSPATVTLAVGVSVQLLAAYYDAQGATVAGPEIAWSSSDGLVAEVGDGGLVWARGPGTATVTARGGGLSGTAAIRVPAPGGGGTPPPPGGTVRGVVVAGDGQTALAGAELPDPLVVRVLDAAGRPLAGYLVNFVVVTGGGSAYGGVAITNSAGEAIDRWRLGPVVGAQRMEVRVVDSTTGAALVLAAFGAVARAP